MAGGIRLVDSRPPVHYLDVESILLEWRTSVRAFYPSCQFIYLTSLVPAHGLFMD